jgi:cellulose synthase/poly-beta-1,6-N-acetylglucosamine synthase-like glycosyltransferase
VEGVVEAVGIVTLSWFAALNLIYAVFTFIAWRDLHEHARTDTGVLSAAALASPMTPAVSVVLPAFDEQAGIVASVRSLLTLEYPEHEVIVVNDGSTDATLRVLQEAFALVPARRALRDGLATQPVRAVYVSSQDDRLVVVDKDNGGKADALNCGVNTARAPYVCAVDADAVLERDALLRIARPMLDEPGMVAAAGGIVRIANGCTIDDGRVVDVRLPRSRLATFQVVEYFRAFLVGRVGWSRLRSLLIISGAFGLFRRDLVEAVGGWATDTVGEDVELVVRLHRYLRGRGEPYRIEFVADPVCWTEVPEDFRTLARQRRRWHRGLAETMWRHRGAIGRPSLGPLGLLGMPYFLVFELLGPLIALAGYVILPLSWAFGLLDTDFLLAFLGMSVALGVLLSVSALALEEGAFRRHLRHRDAARLLAYAIVENAGFRQLTDALRVVAFVDIARRRGGWGEQRRRGIGAQAA